MRILFIINTPAQAYTWTPIIKELMMKGHHINILSREYQSTVEIINSNGLKSESFKPITNKYLRPVEIFVHLIKGLKIARRNKLDMVIGFGIDATILGFFIGKPSVIFTDNDHTHFQNKFASWFPGVIITPENFKDNLGKKHVRVDGFKEMIYLHPEYFKPDPLIFDELKIKRGEKYVILRFNVFDAVHDIRTARGLSVSEQRKLVEKLKQYAVVFISPESKLPEDLERYILPIPFIRIHHALHYAQLVFADTGTMVTEAGILGTPAIHVGRTDVGNFVELEKKYDLVHTYRHSDIEKAFSKAIELVAKDDSKHQWAIKRQRLISEKTNVRRFIVDLIDNYPESYRKLSKQALRQYVRY